MMGVDILLERYRNGDIFALSRLITLCEDGKYHFEEPDVENYHVIGVTGSPGVGKSSVIDRLAAKFLDDGMKVAVLAVDPSGPFTQGAFLGDRVRMRDLNARGVYIRSMASRGILGGLGPAVCDAINLLAGFGFTRIFVETVGAGQADIDVMNVADTILLVMAPGMGDEIQILKAGIMEIADVYVVNKSDVEEASFLRGQLEALLMMDESGRSRQIVNTSCVLNKGFEELKMVVEKHYTDMVSSGEMAERRRRRKRYFVTKLVMKEIQELLNSINIDGLNFEEIKKMLCRRFLGSRCDCV